MILSARKQSWIKGNIMSRSDDAKLLRCRSLYLRFVPFPAF